MKQLILFCLFFASITSIAQRKQEFLVKLNNDTVSLEKKKAFIDSHAHPQWLIYYENGKKKKLLPDSIKVLRLKGEKGFFDYRPINIHMNNGWSCQHFIREIYRKDNAAFVVSPYCSQCHSLELFLSVDDKFVATFNRNNYRDLINRYFGRNETLVLYAAQKKYRAYKLMEIAVQEAAAGR